MKNDSWGMALRVMASISGWIAFPVIIALFLGQWLDRQFGTEPWLFIITISCCFIISIVGLVTSATKEFKKVESSYIKDKNKNK